MRLSISTLFLLAVVLKGGSAEFCGCESCTGEVWNSLATDASGSYTCGARINWLRTTLGYDEARACSTVSDEFVDGPCGPVCDPTKCRPPTRAPTPQPTPPPAKSYCGCDSCNQAVWDSPATDAAGSYSCGARVTWLKTTMGFDEARACSTVSDEFPNGPCGPVCDPRVCSSNSPKPTPAPSRAPSLRPTNAPSKKPTDAPITPTKCGCSSCTSSVLNSVADGHSCGSRIDWVIANYGYSEADACKLVADEYPTTCGKCHADHCGAPPPTPSPSRRPSPAPTNPVTTYCGCSACTQSVWDSIATDAGGSYTCGARITWLQTEMGVSERDACARVASEFTDGPCGVCACASPPTPTPPTPTPPTPTNPNQKCGGAVDSTPDSNQACQTFLWGPARDATMPCFAYGGPGDPCHLNNNNDPNDGLDKDPGRCRGDTFYLWDEPDTQGRSYSWAGGAWYSYSRRFAQELAQMRSRGTKVTGPLLKAGGSGVLEQNLREFFNACGSACSNPADPAYIDVIAVNAFCGPWNDASGGCRSGATFIYNEARSASNVFSRLPVYITNWSRLQTSSPSEQVDAINSIDAFFPAGSPVQRVYWFGARDFGGGSQTTGYLTNALPDGRTLGDLWRSKCDSI